MSLLLELCSVSIESRLVNPGIIECVVLVLCIAIKNKHEQASSTLHSLFNSEFLYYALTYLMELLKNPWIINIKRRALECDVGKGELRCSYKVLGGCTSVKVQEKLDVLPEIEYMVNGFTEEWMNKDRDELAAAGVVLLRVLFY
eukprot:TRINITY_DN2403_c0_g2_i2.p3 TRINITY_DN2403_c0_g2~~TRINITY_DN2403_c0_g2_i2.p3  ORF type:complete len:144 (+),score=47.52 TRINITY_DN2403_c0_g2_i2:631-1062(+)